MATFVPMKGSPRKPPTLQIPNVASCAADPNKQSFLDFPAEIRNQINRELLKSNEPVVLVPREVLDCAAVKERVEHLVVWRSTSTVIEETDDDDIESDEDTEFNDRPEGKGRGKEAESGHAFVMDLRMFRICRQLYHEAASIFYGTNTFIFSWHPKVHNANVGQIRHCAEWLNDIGSQLKLLTSVHIDVGLVCPLSFNCRSWGDDEHALCFPILPESLDILPLARVIWANPEATFTLKFIKGNQTMDPSLGGHELTAPEEDQKPEIAVEMLNNALNSLSLHDHLQLRQHARFERLIESVLVDRNDGTGFACYRQSPRDIYMQFQILDNGHTEWREHRRASGIFGLSDPMLRKICGLVVQSSSTVAFNFESNTAHGIESGILGATWRLRTLALDQLHELNHFSVVSTSLEPRTSFGEFKSLKQWWSSCRRGVGPYGYRDWGYGGPRSLELRLQFRTTNVLDLSQARVNVLELIRLTKRISKRYSKKVKITFSSTNAEDDPGRIQSFTTDLEELRVRAFHMLTMVLQEASPSERLDAPELWFDGQGRAIEAVFPDSSELPHAVFANTRPSSDRVEMEWICHKYIDKKYKLNNHDMLERISEQVHDGDLDVDNQVITLWEFLRDCLPSRWHRCRKDKLQRPA